MVAAALVTVSGNALAETKKPKPEAEKATTTKPATTKPPATKPAPAKPPATAPAAAKPTGAKPAEAPKPGSGEMPALMLESKDWKVVTGKSDTGKVCYAMTQPTKKDPPSLKHGDVYFFIATRPAEKVRNEPSLQFGYPLKADSKVTVDIDGKKFDFFTRGDGAWFEKSNDYAAFLDALKKGKKMSATGASARGNPTSYAFSLAGVSAALDGAAKECK
jgi:invasion protein IalB